MPIINSKVDTSHVGSLRGDWRTTEINSTISGKETPTKLNSPLLIAGFPGPGLVGSISTSFIIETLKLRQIACVESEFIVPGVIYVGGKLRHRFRLYANNEGTICVLFVKPRYWFREFIMSLMQ
jgi:predicted ATP-grasp superfamily ATP-dependent carboligase